MTSTIGELEESLREASQKFEHEGNVAQWYGMAFRVIQHFLGDEWCDKYIRLSERPDDFMLNGYSNPEATRYIHQKRVVNLGDILYLLCLHNRNALTVIVERFRKRDIRTTYFEAHIASILLGDGYAIEVKEEIGVLGDDFDLTVEKNGMYIAAEVTSKSESSSLTESSLKNTLSNKRKQLPADRPSILFIILPQHWTASAATESILLQATNMFFSKSRRINCVQFVWESWFDTSIGKATAVCFNPFFHPNPRFPLGDLGLVFEPSVPYDIQTFVKFVQNGDSSIMSELKAGMHITSPSFILHSRE